MRTIKLVLAYDGTRYRGWQRLGSTNSTIQGKLEATLGRLLDEPIEVIGSGRTDAGVHAMGQVASFSCKSAMPTDEMLRKLRMYLPGDVGIVSCEEAQLRFHARYNAKAKTYLYRIWNSPAPCVFIRNQVYRMEAPLNLEAMQEAAQYLLGSHDFRAFCSNKKFNKSTVRTVCQLDVMQVGEEIQVRIRADGFLYNMVRIITGTLIEVGLSRLSPDDIPSILEGENRAMAGYTVPPQGLTLMEVEY